MYDYLEIIDRMIQATGAKNSAKMLEFMGFSNSAASAWKRRKKIPDGSIAKVSELTGVSFQWLKTGVGEMRPVKQKQPLLPPDLAELISDRITGYHARGVELSEGAALLVELYEQMTPDQQRDMLVQAAIRVIGQKSGGTKE